MANRPWRSGAMMPIVVAIWHLALIGMLVSSLRFSTVYVSLDLLVAITPSLFLLDLQRTRRVPIVLWELQSLFLTILLQTHGFAIPYFPVFALADAVNNSRPSTLLALALTTTLAVGTILLSPYIASSPWGDMFAVAIGFMGGDYLPIFWLVMGISTVVSLLFSTRLRKPSILPLALTVVVCSAAVVNYSYAYYVKSPDPVDSRLTLLVETVHHTTPRKIVLDPTGTIAYVMYATSDHESEQDWNGIVAYSLPAWTVISQIEGRFGDEIHLDPSDQSIWATLYHRSIVNLHGRGLTIQTEHELPSEYYANGVQAIAPQTVAIRSEFGGTIANVLSPINVFSTTLHTTRPLLAQTEFHIGLIGDIGVTPNYIAWTQQTGGGSLLRWTTIGLANKVNKFSFPGFSWEVHADANNNRMWIPNFIEPMIVRWDGATQSSEIYKFPIGVREIAIVSNETMLAAQYLAGNVIYWDNQHSTEIDSWHAGFKPEGLAWDTRRNQFYVASERGIYVGKLTPEVVNE